MIAKICGVKSQQIAQFRGSHKGSIETLPVKDYNGHIRDTKIYPEQLIKECIAKYNPELLLKMCDAGFKMYFYQLAGYEIKVEKPRQLSRLELAKEQVRMIEEEERLNVENKILKKDHQRQAELIDELFGYSSVIKVATLNCIHESLINWRPLKAASMKLGLPPKKVPSSRYATGQNLYPNEAWKEVYPDLKLPEPPQSLMILSR